MRGVDEVSGRANVAAMKEWAERRGLGAERATWLESMEAVNAVWAKQRKRFFLRRWFDELTGRALRERVIAGLGGKP